jgi:hypothetical protein
MLVTELLAHELGHPVVLVILSVLGLQAGDYERHVCGCGCGEVGCEGFEAGNFKVAGKWWNG